MNKLIVSLIIFIFLVGTASAVQTIGSNTDKTGTSGSANTNDEYDWMLLISRAIPENVNGTITLTYKAFRDVGADPNTIKVCLNSCIIELVPPYDPGINIYTWHNVTVVANNWVSGSTVEVWGYGRNVLWTYADALTLKYNYIDGILFILPIKSNTHVSTNHFIVNVSITAPNGLKNLTWNWNGTSYTVFNNSTVLYMNFDNNSAIGDSSTNIVDLSNSHNNGTYVNGAVWNSSGAVDCNGGYVDLGTSDSLNLASPFTIEAKIFPTSFGAGNKIIFRKGSALPNYMLKNADGLPDFTIVNDSGLTYYVRGNMSDWNLNQWNIIRGEFDGITLKLYTNNVYRGFTNFEGTIRMSSSDEAHLCDNIAGGAKFLGLIDNVQIFNYIESDYSRKMRYNYSLYKSSNIEFDFISNQTLIHNLWYPFLVSFTNGINEVYTTKIWNIKYGNKIKTNRGIII